MSTDITPREAIIRLNKIRTDKGERPACRRSFCAFSLRRNRHQSVLDGTGSVGTYQLAHNGTALSCLYTISMRANTYPRCGEGWR